MNTGLLASRSRHDLPAPSVCLHSRGRAWFPPLQASASSDTEEESKKDGTETDQGSPVPPVSLLPSHPAEQGKEDAQPLAPRQHQHPF